MANVLLAVFVPLSEGGPPSRLPHLHPAGPLGHGAAALPLPGPQCQLDVRAPWGPGQWGPLLHGLQVRRSLGLFICGVHGSDWSITFQRWAFCFNPWTTLPLTVPGQCTTNPTVSFLSEGRSLEGKLKTKITSTT